MNVSWLLEDLELFENQFNFLESTVCTIAIFITFVLAIIVHRAFYKLMKRLPGRDINQVIFPYMVKLEAKSFIIYKSHFENFNGIEIEIWACFGAVGSTEKNFFKNIVESPLQSCIK